MRLSLLILLGLCLASSMAQAAPREFDVVVYGGTSGGVAAAVQVSRMGKSVVLIEPSKHLGGLTSGGLGATDIGNKAAIGGISREFYQRIRKHYQDDANWKYEKRSEFKGHGHDAKEDTAWTFEPHVAEKIYNDFINEHRIVVVYSQRLDWKNGVKKDGSRIVSITMESGESYAGKMYIDATYEGDLMAKAGVSYHVGREANKTYGETLNGVQVKNATHHQFIKKVDPYVKPGDPSSGLVPRVTAGPPGIDGEGDQRVQAYNYRLCATDRPENRRPWPKPANYDEKQYELLLRNFEAGDLRLPWSLLLMPNRKTDCNNNFAFSTDDIGRNYAYPDADYATRTKIIREHIDYQMGLMWTLANHPRVPQKVREYFQTWGLAKDEFTDTDNWPHQLYVREARRMIGDYVMTEQNCRGQRVAEDSVGLAAYTMDSHNIQRYVTKDGHILNEGDVQVGGFSPYPISYHAIVPKATECTNLLVPVCLSASHISYGSIRMEPVFMVLGQSSATAAVLAIDGNRDVQKVDYARLRARLLADKQVLGWPLSLQVFSTRDKKNIGFGEMIDRLMRADIVCIGEVHDNASVHRVQLQIIKALSAQDERLGVGLEMFQRPFQKDIDRYCHGDVQEEEFLKATEYKVRWGYDWSLYRPIVEFCRKNDVPLAALNAPRELTRRLSQVGYEHLSSDEQKQLGTIDFQVKAHRDYWYDLLPKLHGQKDATPEQKEKSYQVMTTWDEFMADSAAKFQQERRLRRIVVLAGNGHIERGFGIPDRAVKRTGGKAATIRIAVGSDIEKVMKEPTTDFVVLVR